MVRLIGLALLVIVLSTLIYAADVIEIEKMTGVATWIVADDAKCSGGKYVYREGKGWASPYKEASMEPPDVDLLTATVNVPESGLYKIELTANSADAGSDSIWIKVKGTDVSKSENITRPDGWVKFGIDSTGDWVNQQVLNADKKSSIVVFYLKKGEQELTIGYREPNAKLDKITISKNQ
jgi:hypothetical protein